LKPWMAENQLEWILDHIPDPGYFVEHGAGGSSVWFHDRLKPTQKHLAIECNWEWAEKVKARCPNTEVWRTRHHHIRHKDGMEHSCFCPEYIGHGSFQHADVIVVDGFNRGPVLSWISWHAKNGCHVFIHDFGYIPFVWALHLPPFKDHEIVESKDHKANPNSLLRVRVER